MLCLSQVLATERELVLVRGPASLVGARLRVGQMMLRYRGKHCQVGTSVATVRRAGNGGILEALVQLEVDRRQFVERYVTPRLHPGDTGISLPSPRESLHRQAYGIG